MSLSAAYPQPPKLFQLRSARNSQNMIETVDHLRALYTAPAGRSITKQLDRLDRHCEQFIALSPYVVIATAGVSGKLDASPRGGSPGFITVHDATTLWLPDSPGNNRLDSLNNIIETGRIGLLFMIPGVDETLRVNGRAHLNDAPDILARCADHRGSPKLVIEVSVEEAYLHCAKALMRSKLWDAGSRQPRSVLPTMGQMLNDQTGELKPAESQDEMVARYARDL